MFTHLYVFIQEMANMLDCDIVVSEFGLQTYYYVIFWTNTLGEGMNLLILPVMG